MNGSDLRVLREYMGCKYDSNAETTPSPIHYLDLSSAYLKSSEDICCIYGDFSFRIDSDGELPCNVFYKLKSDTPVSLCLGTKNSMHIEIIGASAFDGANLDYVTAEGVNTITENAFTNSTLKGIDLSNLTAIYYGAFMNCLYLRSLELPEGVTYIEDNIIENTPAMEYLYMPYSITFAGPQSIATDNLKTLKLMTKSGVNLPAASDITLTKGGSKITGKHIDCDLYLCNERQGEVTEGNTWNGNTWKSITFVDGTTLK